MKLLIVDDEPPARDRLRRLLADIDGCEVIAEAANGEEALACCSELRPDVVLLDVRMPGLSGIQVARHIDTLDDPPAVIFTTAYDQYAVDAFETEAVGYLLKPVRKEKLAHALRHAARISPSRLVKVAESARLEHRREQICARLGDQLRLIPIGDVYYFLADQKYVTVRHKGGESLIDAFEFMSLIKKKMEVVHIPKDFLTRSVNQGFSGGHRGDAGRLRLRHLQAARHPQHFRRGARHRRHTRRHRCQPCHLAACSQR